MNLHASVLRAAAGAVLLAGLLPPSDVHAQLKGGVSFSTLTGIEGFQSRTGLMAGIGLSFLQLGPVSLTPELLYVQKGGTLDSPTASGIEDIRLDYFVVPVLLEVGSYIRGTPIRPSAYGGAYYAFQTSCSLGFTDQDRSNGCLFVSLQEAGIDANIEDADWGWVIGGTLGVVTGIGTFSLDARYTASISDIARSGSVDEPKNRSIEISAGWRPDFR